jgi:hypothetical protein
VTLAPPAPVLAPLVVLELDPVGPDPDVDAVEPDVELAPVAALDVLPLTLPSLEQPTIAHAKRSARATRAGP